MGVIDSTCMDATVVVNYIEIYNDQLTDLISGDPVTLYRVGVGQVRSRVRVGVGGLGLGSGLITLYRVGVGQVMQHRLIFQMEHGMVAKHIVTVSSNLAKFFEALR